MDSMVLADSSHPQVRKKAQELIASYKTREAKVQAIAHYVRDGILFGFPKEGDFVKASTTISYGFGQCNTKGTLFLALCKAAGIPARIHFSLIRKDIQRGLFTGIAYWMMPDEISHSWIEVQLNGRWKKIDSYINDTALCKAGMKKLEEKGWETGFSISTTKKTRDASHGRTKNSFVQMGAVTTDHGTYSDPGDYYQSPLYRNRPNAVKLFLYRLLIGTINKRIQNLRRTA